MKIESSHRREFLRKSTLAAMAVMTGKNTLAQNSTPVKDQLFLIGPLEGFSPHIGTLVSMMNYNRYTITNLVKFLTMEELDYLHDKNSNTIAALLMHLGALDKFYQINTFEGRGEFTPEENKKWGPAMTLGEEGRKLIKGRDVNYYLDAIGEIREKTIAELKKRDDEWLLAVDPEWSQKQSVNTYWKWFHVVEHESNHRGQISWLKNRLPGSTPSKD